LELKPILGPISILLTVAAYSRYVRKILNKHIHPHPVSWFLWGVVTLVAYYVQQSQDAGPGSWATGLTAIVCFGISGLCFWHFSDNDQHLSVFDVSSLALGLVACWFYWSQKSPIGAAISATIADLIGYGPTVIKGLKKPHDDDPVSFLLNGLKFFAAYGALRSYSVSTALYPLAIGAANVAVFVMLTCLRRAAPH
jgi:hypothetical protein